MKEKKKKRLSKSQKVALLHSTDPTFQFQFRKTS